MATLQHNVTFAVQIHSAPNLDFSRPKDISFRFSKFISISKVQSGFYLTNQTFSPSTSNTLSTMPLIYITLPLQDASVRDGIVLRASQAKHNTLHPLHLALDHYVRHAKGAVTAGGSGAVETLHTSPAAQGAAKWGVGPAGEHNMKN